MTKEELQKENERLREENKELEKRYNQRCFELELLKSQLGMGPCDLTKFCKQGFKD